MNEEQPQRMCASCGEEPAGPGGVLGRQCFDRLTQTVATYWQTHRQVGNRVELIDNESA